MFPAVARQAVEELVGRLDLALPGRLEGFYVVGSASLGAFRVGRSDLDFLAVIDGDLDSEELRRLRSAHRGHCAAAVRRSIVRPRWCWPLLCNGVYVRRGDPARSSLDVVPIASHVAFRFSVSSGFDVNPVTWRTLVQCGIPVRGPHPSRLDVHEDDEELRAWTRDNLNGYWRSWASAARGHGWTASKALTRRFAAWGVLGAPRLSYTISTGEIATKEQAALYALDTFDPKWHPIVEEALTYRRGGPSRHPYRDPIRRRRDAADFVTCVIERADETPDA